MFGFQPFTMSHYRKAVHTLTELAMQTNKGIVLASALRLAVVTDCDPVPQ